MRKVSSSSESMSLELVSRFKCLVNDSFGKLMSKEANIYRLRIDVSNLNSSSVATIGNAIFNRIHSTFVICILSGQLFNLFKLNLSF